MDRKQQPPIPRSATPRNFLGNHAVPARSHSLRTGQGLPLPLYACAGGDMSRFGDGMPNFHEGPQPRKVDTLNAVASAAGQRTLVRPRPASANACAGNETSKFGNGLPGFQKDPEPRKINSANAISSAAGQHTSTATIPSLKPHSPSALLLTSTQRAYIRSWAKNGVWPHEFAKGVEVTASVKSTSSASESGDLNLRNKELPYFSTNFEAYLEYKGRFHLSYHSFGPSTISLRVLEALRGPPKTHPDTMFKDDQAFDAALKRLRQSPQATVRCLLMPALIPDVNVEIARGATCLSILTKTQNDVWTDCICVAGLPRPQPDYSVGFNRDAFSVEELIKLQPFLGDSGMGSHFQATESMLFPFLVCEVQGAGGYERIAMRRNAHSMAVAMKGACALFASAGILENVNCRMLGFSVYHNQEEVVIWCHYPVVQTIGTHMYHHKVMHTKLQGHNRFQPNQFIRNIYTIWMPAYQKILKMAIAKLIPCDPPVSSK